MFCLKLFYWLLVILITFERFSFFLSVFDCFDQLSVFVLFGGFVISKQVFNDFKRFGTVLVKKKAFFVKKFCFAVWS